MAVDIKTLRIGSHILANDVRATIERLDTYKFPDGKKRPWGYFHGKVNGEYRECGSFLDVDNVEPIPITPELLKELGFVNTSSTRRITYTKGSEYEDSWIEFKNLKDRWEVFGSKDNWDGRIVCRYLHEAEAFLALHGVELIQD